MSSTKRGELYTHQEGLHDGGGGGEEGEDPDSYGKLRFGVPEEAGPGASQVLT